MQYKQIDKNIASPASPKPGLFDQMRERLRYQRYRFEPKKPRVWARHLHTLATDKNHPQNDR